MSMEFSAVADPAGELCRQVADTAPANPFYTFEYLESKRAAGSRPWLLLLREEGRVVSGCPAFVHVGMLTRSLEIESLPILPNGDLFWEQLQKFCRESGISELSVHTAASPNVAIPSLSGEIWRKSRCEYVIELSGRDLWKQLRPTHRQRVNRSRKAGVAVKRAEGAQAWQDHADAVRASMLRRTNRGEAFAEIKQTRFFEALMQSGRGQLFQAYLDNKVLSSAFVIEAERGAYYHWAGNSPEGMALGSSHFLIHEIATRLQERQFTVFNLGGTGLENKGLVEFKRGFGTTEMHLENAGFCFGSRVVRKLGRVLERLREDPGQLLKRGMNRLTRRVQSIPS